MLAFIRLRTYSNFQHPSTLSIFGPFPGSTRHCSTHATSISQFGSSGSSKKFKIESNWCTLQNQALSKYSLQELFSNVIPAIVVPDFLSKSECQQLLDIVITHPMGSYGKIVNPPIGSIGITQYEHQKNKEAYFSRVEDALSLQKRFERETKIDIIARVRRAIQQVTSLPVRIATEGDKEYFAGLLRCINSSALIHADFGQYDGPKWEIGKISAQLTWNILLKKVEGGDTIVYDRLWQGSEDIAFKKQSSYGYSPAVVEGRAFKVLNPIEGSLTFFNSRNFHEVKVVDRAKEERRYTMSSFVGLIPDGGDGRPAIILWS